MSEKVVIRCCNCKDCIEEPDDCDMSDRITCPTCRETWTRMFWITPDFQFGEIEGGTYLNGERITGSGISSMDCSTYNPGEEQSINVDAGLYIN